MPHYGMNEWGKKRKKWGTNRMQHLRSWMGAAKDPPSDFPRDVPGDRGDRAGRRPREEKGRLVSKAWGRMGVAMGFYRV